MHNSTITARLLTIRFLGFLGFTPKGAATPGSVVGGTPGRASVRDKLSINREEAFENDSESEFSKRQQQVWKNLRVNL